MAELEVELEQLLALFHVPQAHWRMARTIDGLRRRFGEVGRRTRSIGMFANDESVERLVYGLFAYQNRKRAGVACRESRRSKEAA